MKFIWKVMLRAIFFRDRDSNKYIGEVVSQGKTMNNEGVADAIVEDGTEYKREAIIDILSRRDYIHRRSFGRGEGTQDENFYYGLHVGGTMHGATAKFDPAKNSARIKARPTAKLRKLLKSTCMEVVGVKEPSARIGKVFDYASETTDDIITPDEDILISGIGLQIAPLNNISMGVFFTNVETGEVFRVNRKFGKNSSASILTRTPKELPEGKYDLKIVTCFADRKNRLLKSPRTLTFKVKLTVAGGSNDKNEKTPANNGKQNTPDNRKQEYTT